MFLRRDTPSVRIFRAASRLGVLCCVLPALLNPSAPSPQSPSPTYASSTVTLPVEQELDRISAEGMRQIQKSDLLLAAQTMRQGAHLAIAAGNLLRAGRFLNASGAVSQKMLQLRDALDSYREADSIAARLLSGAAEESGPAPEPVLELASASALNLCTLYLQMDDADAAEARLGEAHARMGQYRRHEVQFLALSGQLRYRQQRLGEAGQYLQQAVEAAGGAADNAPKAAALLALGEVRADLGQYEMAEAALLASYRVRTLQRLGGQERNLRMLAALELRRGNAAAAGNYARAAERLMPAQRGAEAQWRVWMLKGDVQRQLGERAAALESYRKAGQQAAAWRAALVPSFTALTESDVRIASLAEHHADLAAELAAPSGAGPLAEEGLLSVERQRAASILLLFSRHSETTELGPRYASLVARLRLLEMSGRPEDAPLRAAVLRQVSDIEARGFPGFDPAAGGAASRNRTIAALRHALPPDSAAISYLVLPQRTWRWTITASDVRVDALPGAEVLATHIAAYRTRPSRAAGRSLGDLLLGGLPSAARNASSWYLSLDGPLFEVPFAGLVEGDGAFVVERHSVRTVPSLMTLLRAAPAWTPGSMLAVADLVYNRADPRIQGKAPAGLPLAFGFLRQAPGTMPHQRAAERPRLAGSAREADRLTLQWRSNALPVRSLAGPSADGRALAAELDRRPSIIHFAGHIDSGGPAGLAAQSPLTVRPFIPLSLRADGTSDALHSSAIMRLQLPATLVVLNGCDSGLGRARAGLGLTGLSQAWLLGGASAVVGSLWPVRDDDAPIFLDFYARIAEGTPAPVALRMAQLACLRSGGWRSEPAYWAAWNVTAKR